MVDADLDFKEFDKGGFSKKTRDNLGKLGFLTDAEIDDNLSAYYKKNPKVPKSDLAFIKSQLVETYQHSENSLPNFNAWRIETWRANIEGRTPDPKNINRWGGNSDKGHRPTRHDIEKSRVIMRAFITELTPDTAQKYFPDVVEDTKRFKAHAFSRKQLEKLSRQKADIEDTITTPIDLPYRMTHNDSSRIYNHTAEPELQHTLQHDPIPPHFDSIRRRNRIELYSTF